MNIEFVKQGNAYVAEFKVEADFNLHIEKDKNGHITLYQRTSEGGKYALLEEFGYQDGKLVYESDAAGLIYPKYIKVVSAVMPTYAVVTSAGEVTEIKSQTKEIEVTANGTTEVTPDAGFAYLNSVKVKTNVAQSGGGGGNTGGGEECIYLKTIQMITVDAPEYGYDMVHWLIKDVACIVNQFHMNTRKANIKTAARLDLMNNIPLGIAIAKNMIASSDYCRIEQSLEETLLSIEADYGYTFPRITKEEFYNLKYEG